MAAKSTDWRPGPTVCRCCLSEGCYKDISTEYFWMGKREVYAEMLMDAFNLTISYSQSGGPNSNSRLICEPCISRLRDASDFKRQVQECEKTFTQYLDPGNSSINDYEVEVPLDQLDSQVKVEQVKVERQGSDDDDFDDRADFDDDDDDLDNQPLTKLASKVPKKESVDLLDLLDNAKGAVKRKSSTKTKASPAKKSKTTKKEVKPTSSKTVKLEKKKKGDTTVRRCIPIRPIGIVTTPPDGAQPSMPIRPIGIVRIGESSTSILKDLDKKQMTRISAVTIIVNTNVCPFQFSRFFMCLYCKNRFITVTELQQHTSSEHFNIDEYNVRKAIVRTGRIQPVKINIVDFTCRICNQELSNFEDLKNHLVGKHKKEIDLVNDGVVPFRITENTYMCGRCDEKYGNYRLLTRHMNEHYSNFICDQCGSGFPSEGRLKSHAHSHEHGSFPCEVCGKVYRTILAKQDHFKIVHLNAKKNRCTLCPETFRDYYQKQKHLVEVHGKQKNSYKCSFCSKTFLTSSNMRAHERLAHVKGHKYSCDHCSYHTYDKYALTLHMICHSDEKNHKCHVCKKSYARRKTLTEHMKIHNNVRRFVCQYCDRAFVQKCSLKGHMKTHHKDVQNFEC